MMHLKFRLGRRKASPLKSGGESRGARICRVKLTAGLLLAAVAALMVTGCGGSSNTPVSTATSTPTTGAIYTFITDTPSCDVLSLGVFITELDLHKAGKPSTSLVTVWPTNTSPTSPVVEVSTLRDAMTVLNLTSIPPGTYDQAVVKAVVNTSSIFDPTQSPPVSAFSPTLASASATFNIQPTLTVTGGQVSGLLLDLNVPQSLIVNSQGQLTGTLKWVFTARPLVANSTTGFGEMDDLHGFVRSVTPTLSTTSTFTSSFLLQTLSATSNGAGPALNIDLTDQTNLIGVPQLNQLPTGNYAEVDGYVDEKGNLVAKTIQVEDREDITKQLLGYVGPVLDVTKDSSGNVTQFDMLARETQPEDSTDIPNDSPLTVYVSSSTTFNPYLLSSDLANLASSGNLAFADNTLVPGEEVVVHGVFSKSSGGPITVAANSIYPRQQGVQGTFLSLVGTPGSDDKTGAFYIAPCATILSNTNYPFMVVTDAQTSFLNTSGLSTLSPTTPLVVRGLLFLSLQSTTIQGTGTPVPAGTLVLLAKEVRQS